MGETQDPRVLPDALASELKGKVFGWEPVGDAPRLRARIFSGRKRTDHRDIAAMLSAGVSLERALGGFAAR